MFKKMMMATLIGLTLSATNAQDGVRINFGTSLPISAPPPTPIYIAAGPVYVVPAPATVFAGYASAPIYIRPIPAPVCVHPSTAPAYVQPAAVPITR
jgi:hypothetical protein